MRRDSEQAAGMAALVAGRVRLESAAAGGHRDIGAGPGVTAGFTQWHNAASVCLNTRQRGLPLPLALFEFPSQD